MRLEKLTVAAKAAGYAMAFSDDLLTSTKSKVAAEPNAWRAGEIKPMSEQTMAPKSFEWRRSLYQLFGWSAHA